MRRPRLLATLHISGDHTLVSTPSGYVRTGDTGRARYVLAAPNPRTPDSFLYLPFGPLRDFFHRPDQVAAALAGTLRSDASPYADLVAAGWEVDTTWDGAPVFLPRAPSSPPPRAPSPAAPPVTTSSAEENPFLPGRSIDRDELLVGRARMLADIDALVQSRQPAVIVGPRRSGKTSFITVFEQRLRRAGRPVRRVSLEGEVLPDRDHLALLLCPELRRVKGAANRFLTRFRAERAAVFLVDEVVHLIALPPRDLAWVRKVCQETASFVFAGSPWDWECVLDHGARLPGSSLGNDVQPVQLGAIDPIEAAEFLVRTAPADAPIAAARAQQVVERCGAWPYYLQVMGWELVQRSRGGDRDAHNRSEALARLVEEELPRRARAAFLSRWNELPTSARQALASLAAPVDLPRDARDVLSRAGLLLDGRVWLHDPPFRAWIERNAPHLPIDHEAQ